MFNPNSVTNPARDYGPSWVQGIGNTNVGLFEHNRRSMVAVTLGHGTSKPYKLFAGQIEETSLFLPNPCNVLPLVGTGAYTRVHRIKPSRGNASVSKATRSKEWKFVPKEKRSLAITMAGSLLAILKALPHS